MASSNIPTDATLRTDDEPPFFAFGETLRKILAPLASLRLTVVLFALAIFIVLAGTFAQVNHDIWHVVNEYFRVKTPITGIGAFFVWIDLQLFLPPSFFASAKPPNLPAWMGFYFPNGWVIGTLMAVNLLCAHLIRFKPQARGGQLWAGVAVIVAGIIGTALVVQSGNDKHGLQHETWLSYDGLWWVFVGSLAATAAASVVAAVRLRDDQRLERRALVAVSALLGAAFVWLAAQGGAGRMDDSGMRILWQLLKAVLFSAVPLAVGCALVFKKRGGVVVLHAGVGLMMFSEVLVGTSAVESQMVIEEGQTVNFAQDIRELELAVIDRSQPKVDQVVAIPESYFKDKEGTVIKDEALPFHVRIDDYRQNSVLRQLKPGEETPVTDGTGTRWTLAETKPFSGVRTDGAVDQSAAVVTLLDKQTGKPLGTYLVGILFSQLEVPQQVTVGDTTYDLALRFRRHYKDYAVTLHDVRKDDYLGTNIPKNYSSDIHLTDTDAGVDRDVKIWMNNPLRFAGETFYQTNYAKAPDVSYDPLTLRETVQYETDPETGRREPREVEITTLSVVTNTGWMIPYVACMIVAAGMFVHFGIVLLRFLNRRAAGETAVSRAAVAAGTDGERWGGYGGAVMLSVAVVVIFGGWLIGKAVPPSPPPSEFDLYEFGQLPLAYEGRIKPFDTLARNTLKILSERETFTDAAGEKQPATRWLLDVIAKPDAAAKHKVFRIENFEVLSLLGLERVKGYRYSLADIQPKHEELIEQVALARAADDDDLTLFQRKILDLYGKLNRYQALQAAFRLPPFPTAAEAKENPEAAFRQLYGALDMAAAVDTGQFPRAVPVPSAEEAEEQWIPYSTAAVRDYLWEDLRESPQVSRQLVDLYATITMQLQRADLPREMRQSLEKMQGVIQGALARKESYPSKVALESIFTAYREGDARAFNHEVEEYQALLQTDAPAKLAAAAPAFEAYFNTFAPFFQAWILYIVAFVLAALAWLGWSRPLNWASFSLIAFTFAVHTFALIARMYISGRPPVTNLYSSAVFIGWGAVVLGMVLEMVYRLGIGNIIASTAGFMTLFIADALAADGDTFTVLQAVLDTQFWLATHVTCITFGYATTYVAGFLGLIYVLRGVATPSLTPQVGKDLTRMIYGTICFAIFFSFVGTVLGGLWADDSWGRFWGWDPKENGALIIVLWNALVLHARWGGLVKERGLALLAIGGNIVTSWSWFGVNELGIGLHSYGFTEGVLFALGLFIASQLAVIAVGSMPRNLWWSTTAHRQQS